MQRFGDLEGNRSEYLARYIFSTIGLCVPVPRESDDFNVDLTLHLGTRDGRTFVLNGRSAMLQTKSSEDSVTIEGPDKIRWFLGGMIPFFLVVIDKKRAWLKVFQTTQRATVPGHLKFDKVVLLPNDASGWRVGGDELLCGLGEPIISIDYAKLDDLDEDVRDKSRRLFYFCIDQWCILEMTAMVWKQHGLPFTPFPTTRKTNEPFSFADLTYFIPASLHELRPATKALTVSLIAMERYISETCLEVGSPALAELRLTDALRQVSASLTKLQAEMSALDEELTRVWPTGTSTTPLKE